MFPFDRTQNIKKPNVFEYFQGNQKERFGRKVLTLFHTGRTVLCQFDSHCCFLFLCVSGKFQEDSIQISFFPTVSSTRTTESLSVIISLFEEYNLRKSVNISKVTLQKKWSFLLWIFLRNVTKSPRNYGFGCTYRRNPWWKTSFLFSVMTHKQKWCYILRQDNFQYYNSVVYLIRKFRGIRRTVAN